MEAVEQEVEAVEQEVEPVEQDVDATVPAVGKEEMRGAHNRGTIGKNMLSLG